MSGRRGWPLVAVILAGLAAGMSMAGVIGWSTLFPIILIGGAGGAVLASVAAWTGAGRGAQAAAFLVGIVAGAVYFGGLAFMLGRGGSSLR